MLMCPCNGVIIHLSTELYLLTTCTYYMVRVRIGVCLSITCMQLCIFFVIIIVITCNMCNKDTLK